MSLKEYRHKRNFSLTDEPRGKLRRSSRNLKFTIQKHAASHLHYDLRLELDGVLKSWAVPKGPSLNPKQKRLAIHVEDHPLDYGSFEGNIPDGEYGGGTVLLWDRGAWEPVEDAELGYREGHLKFILHGEKLHGRWVLLKTTSKAIPSQRNWLLIKERDEFADTFTDITTTMPKSVSSNRGLDEIALDKVPSRKKPTVTQKSERKSKLAVKSKSEAQSSRPIQGKPTSLPKSISVQLASRALAAPAGDDWLHEIKFDGYRMLCSIDAGTVRFTSRNGKDWTSRFVTLEEAAKKLPIRNAILDGEVVVLKSDGTTNFQLLQNAFQFPGSIPFVFYAFDLLYHDGYDIRTAAIEDRKETLRTIIPAHSNGLLRFSDHVVGNGTAFFGEASRLKLEGIISKRRGQPYVSGRGHDWLKVKFSLREEFVIGGFTEPAGSRNHFGALLLGHFDPFQRLQYVGRVGTGFDDRTLSALNEKFAKLIQKKCPFSNFLDRDVRRITWLNPSLVAQVTFSNWTNERHLRHPSFQGLREDKDASDVVRDASETFTERPLRKAPSVPIKQETASTKTERTSQSIIKRNTIPGNVAGVRLTHPEKDYYPNEGITKLDLARYYERVADWMLPHVSDRLLSLVRCPGGSGKCFFQKHPGEGVSEHLHRYSVSEKKETTVYLALVDLPGLISLVQMGVLEIHQWGSRAPDYEKPDRLIFDLDPDPLVEWPKMVVAANEVRLLLETLGLVCFLKTTGGKGLHLVVPIRRRTNWEDAKLFCRAVADFLVANAPERYVATMSKAARKGKIFIDYLRNDRGATAIAPYSTRAHPGAPVSVPIEWSELDNKLTSGFFNIRNLPPRLMRLNHDPWRDMSKVNQTITKAMLRKLKVR